MKSYVKNRGILVLGSVGQEITTNGGSNVHELDLAAQTGRIPGGWPGMGIVCPAVWASCVSVVPPGKGLRERIDGDGEDARLPAGRGPHLGNVSPGGP